MKLTYRLITLLLAALILVSSVGIVVFKMECLTGEGETHVSLWEKASSCNHEKKVITEKSCCHADEKAAIQQENKPCCEFTHNYVKLDKETTPPSSSVFHFNEVWALLTTHVRFARTYHTIVSENSISCNWKPPLNSSGKTILITIQTFRI